MKHGLEEAPFLSCENVCPSVAYLDHLFFWPIHGIRSIRVIRG
jgi:hypothetical protein